MAKKETWMATTAGILNIVAGSLRVIVTLLVALFFAALAIFSRGDMTCLEQLPIAITASVVITLAIFSLIVSILAIVGGIYALRRKNWGMALAGAIAAFFCSAPLGIAAIVFTALSKNEFE
ncbi:MAG: hypothetical protein JXB43_05900 [Dehalococcoidia bacterium]|nr:hypothetical protein [Dehalococcoidia bacterium]